MFLKKKKIENIFFLFSDPSKYFHSYKLIHLCNIKVQFFTKGPLKHSWTCYNVPFLVLYFFPNLDKVSVVN